MSSFKGFGAPGPPEGFEDWEAGVDGQPLSDSQLALQQDLSSLADGELDEGRAAGVMLRLESDSDDSAYLDDLTRCAKMHRDMTDPDRLMAHMAAMTGASNLCTDLENRLATIFYQLGKAYLLAALDPDRVVERVFETAVPVEQTRVQGRGFVDGVLLSSDEEPIADLGSDVRRGDVGRGDVRRDGVDWENARSMLNGRLERIEEPLEKARRLLEQALSVAPDHEEAQFYRAYLDAEQGRKLLARERWAQLFDTALLSANRGHAAIQIGRLHQGEGNHREALRWYRWILISGLFKQDERFWVVRFNIAMTYLEMGDHDRCLDYFKGLIDSQPQHVAEMAHMASQAPLLQKVLQQRPSFANDLISRCPELFSNPAA